MDIKIEDVVGFGNVLRALFVANYDGVIGLDEDFEDDWLVDVYDVQKQEVFDMVGTAGMRKLKKGDIAKRNMYMDSELPLTVKMDYVIKKCIKAGTITGTKGSFKLATFNRSISNRNVGLFHTNYMVTFARMNSGGNAAALNSKGFTTVMQGKFKTLHDKAWAMNTTKIDLAQDINTLSDANLVVIERFLKTCMLLIAAIRAYARSIKNKELAKRATFKGIKKSVEPSKDKKARDLKIDVFASRVVATDLPVKYKLRMTLLTKGVSVTVCRKILKTGICSAGIPLVANEMLEVVKNDLPGEGERVVITNLSGKKIVVKYLKIAVA